MLKSKMIVSTCLVLFLFVSSGFAQWPSQVGLKFTTGFPQQGFQKNIGNDAFGGSGYFLYDIEEAPFSIGLSLNVLGYGYDSREVPLSTTIPDVIVDVSTTNIIFSPYLLTRFQSHVGTIRPYGDLLFGFNLLTTNTSVSGENNLEDDLSSNDHSDIALSYGAGFGFMIQVWSYEDMNKVLFIDIGTRYLKGNEAEYLRDDSKRIDGTRVAYDVYQSSTDMIHGYLGLSFAF